MRSLCWFDFYECSVQKRNIKEVMLTSKVFIAVLRRAPIIFHWIALDLLRKLDLGEHQYCGATTTATFHTFLLFFTESD